MAVKKRRTVAEMRAAVAEGARDDAIAEVCQVLKWHLNYTLIAEQLWEAMHSGTELKRGPGHPWVTVPPLEMN